MFEVHENIPNYVFLPDYLIFTEHQGGVSAADQTEKNCDLWQEDRTSDHREQYRIDFSQPVFYLEAAPLFHFSGFTT